MLCKIFEACTCAAAVQVCQILQKLNGSSKVAADSNFIARHLARGRAFVVPSFDQLILWQLTINLC